MNKFKAIIVGSSIIILLFIIFYYYYQIEIPNQQKFQSSNKVGKDAFGINEIYPTKDGGREWYINMNNPYLDRSFSITSDIPITKSKDDINAWFINNSQIRININTPDGKPEWKNIEMTGYVKVKSILKNPTINDNGPKNTGNEESVSTDLTWRARGGPHNDRVPCEGTALNSGINIIDKKASWKKEIWHTGGYTDSRGESQSTEKPFVGRWIGWKAIMYNINNNTSVKMESYIDDNNDNNWKKVNEVIDDGGWYANSSDEVFYSAKCNKPKDYIIINGGPLATFRADNISFDFKNLSIREIST